MFSTIQKFLLTAIIAAAATSAVNPVSAASNSQPFYNVPSPRNFINVIINWVSPRPISSFAIPTPRAYITNAPAPTPAIKPQPSSRCGWRFRHCSDPLPQFCHHTQCPGPAMMAPNFPCPDGSWGGSTCGIFK